MPSQYNSILHSGQYAGQTDHKYPLPSKDVLGWGQSPEEPDYYIYFYHTGDYILLPTYPDQMTDSMSVQYSSEFPLGRSAPLQSYTNSGPRTIQFTFKLHRDMMWQINYDNTSIEVDDDYVEEMAHKIQGIAVPEYSMSDKMISPPMVAVRIGNELFIKGVVTGAVGVSYEPPILRTGKYACLNISFSVTEITPYGASDIMRLGSYRNTTFGPSTVMKTNYTQKV